MTSKTTSPRKRGAPPGNLNALKHGFYSRQLKPMRKDGPIDSGAADALNLGDEIAMLRLFIRRVIHMGAEVEDLEAAIALLRVLCLATTTLTRLLKTQQLFGQDDFGLAIQQAIDELAPVLFGPELLAEHERAKANRLGAGRSS